MRKGKRKGFKELYAHTKMRMQERYNVELTEEKYRQMCASIKHGRDNVRFLTRQTATRSVFIVDMLDMHVVAVYNRKASLVCTVLPKELNHADKIKYREYFSQQ
jgi:hypothetical protein